MSLISEGLIRRRNIRTKTDLAIKLRVISDRNWFEGRMLNVSRCGACVEDIPELPPGTPVEVIVFLDKPAKYYSLSAQVVWTGDNKTGLRFADAP